MAFSCSVHTINPAASSAQRKARGQGHLRVTFPIRDGGQSGAATTLHPPPTESQSWCSSTRDSSRLNSGCKTESRRGQGGEIRDSVSQRRGSSVCPAPLRGLKDVKRMLLFCEGVARCRASLCPAPHPQNSLRMALTLESSRPVCRMFCHFPAA